MSDAKVKNRPIPIDVARELAERFCKSEVVIFSRDEFRSNVVTYGQSVEDKERAAKAGDRLLASYAAADSEFKSHADFRYRLPAQHALLVDQLMDAIRDAQRTIDVLIADRYTTTQDELRAVSARLEKARAVA